MVIASISGLPAFLLYLAVSLGLLALYLLIYTLATAHKEFALIRQNSLSAGVSLGFSLVGFALPLASAVVHAQGILDCLVWGLVALIVQILVYWLVRVLMPDLSQRIASGELASALLLGSASLTGGILAAASMTY